MAFKELKTSHRSGQAHMVDGALLNDFAGALNQLRPVTQLKSEQLKIVKGDNVTHLDIPREWFVSAVAAVAGTGVGLPAGYTFTNYATCVNGNVVYRWWPTWETDPTVEE